MEAVQAYCLGLASFQETPLLITHYTRILEYIKPQFVHMMKDGKIVLDGNYDLAKKIEKYGYDKTFLLGDDANVE